MNGHILHTSIAWKATMSQHRKNPTNVTHCKKIESIDKITGKLLASLQIQDGLISASKTEILRFFGLSESSVFNIDDCRLKLGDLRSSMSSKLQDIKHGVFSGKQVDTESIKTLLMLNGVLYGFFKTNKGTDLTKGWHRDNRASYTQDGCLAQARSGRAGGDSSAFTSWFKDNGQWLAKVLTRCSSKDENTAFDTYFLNSISVGYAISKEGGTAQLPTATAAASVVGGDPNSAAVAASVGGGVADSASQTQISGVVGEEDSSVVGNGSSDSVHSAAGTPSSVGVRVADSASQTQVSVDGAVVGEGGASVVGNGSLTDSVHSAAEAASVGGGASLPAVPSGPNIDSSQAEIGASALILQQAVRGALARRSYVGKNSAATSLQAAAGRVRDRFNHTEHVEAGFALEQAVRGASARKQYVASKSAARSLQAAVRGALARGEYSRIKKFKEQLVKLNQLRVTDIKVCLSSNSALDQIKFTFDGKGRTFRYSELTPLLGGNKRDVNGLIVIANTLKTVDAYKLELIQSIKEKLEKQSNLFCATVREIDQRALNVSFPNATFVISDKLMIQDLESLNINIVTQLTPSVSGCLRSLTCSPFQEYSIYKGVWFKTDSYQKKLRDLREVSQHINVEKSGSDLVFKITVTQDGDERPQERYVSIPEFEEGLRKGYRFASTDVKGENPLPIVYDAVRKTFKFTEDALYVMARGRVIAQLKEKGVDDVSEVLDNSRTLNINYSGSRSVLDYIEAANLLGSTYNPDSPNDNVYGGLVHHNETIMTKDAAQALYQQTLKDKEQGEMIAVLNGFGVTAVAVGDDIQINQTRRQQERFNAKLTVEDARRLCHPHDVDNLKDLKVDDYAYSTKDHIALLNYNGIIMTATEAHKQSVMRLATEKGFNVTSSSESNSLKIRVDDKYISVTVADLEQAEPSRPLSCLENGTKVTIGSKDYYVIDGGLTAHILKANPKPSRPLFEGGRVWLEKGYLVGQCPTSLSEGNAVWWASFLQEFVRKLESTSDEDLKSIVQDENFKAFVLGRLKDGSSIETLVPDIIRTLREVQTFDDRVLYGQYGPLAVLVFLESKKSGSGAYFEIKNRLVFLREQYNVYSSYVKVFKKELWAKYKDTVLVDALAIGFEYELVNFQNERRSVGGENLKKKYLLQFHTFTVPPSFTGEKLAYRQINNRLYILTPSGYYVYKGNGSEADLIQRFKEGRLTVTKVGELTSYWYRNGAMIPQKTLLNA